MSLFPIYSLAVWTLMAPLVVAVWDWVTTRRTLSAMGKSRKPMDLADGYIARVMRRRA
jgi:hypothetical protein